MLDSFFRADSTLTHMTIQVIQLRLNSNPKFASLTQLWLNSKSKFTNLTQLWLNSFEYLTQNPNLLTWLNSDSTHLSQSWVKSDSWLITFYLIWQKVVDRGGGGRSNVAAGLCKVTDKCKISTFSLQRNQWLNVDSSSIQLTQLWLKWRSAWFDSDSTPWFSQPTRLWLDSFESESSQIWLTTHESSITL